MLCFWPHQQENDKGDKKDNLERNGLPYFISVLGDSLLLLFLEGYLFDLITLNDQVKLNAIQFSHQYVCFNVIYKIFSS